MSQEIFRKTHYDKYGRPSKKVMTDFVIDEISSVNEPAQEHAMATLMKSAGVSQKQENGDMEFTEIVERIRLQKNCSGREAMSFARQAHSHAFAKYQADGTTNHQAALDEIAKSAPRKMNKAQLAFHDVVEKMRRDRGFSRVLAMQKARVANPELFSAAYG